MPLNLTTKSQIKEAITLHGGVYLIFEGSRRKFALLFSDERPGTRVYVPNPFGAGIKEHDFPEADLDFWPEPTELQAYAQGQGPHIHDICSRLSPDLREFLISGLTPDEWNELYGTEELQ